MDLLINPDPRINLLRMAVAAACEVNAGLFDGIDRALTFRVANDTFTADNYRAIHRMLTHRRAFELLADLHMLLGDRFDADDGGIDLPMVRP